MGNFDLSILCLQEITSQLFILIAQNTINTRTLVISNLVTFAEERFGAVTIVTINLATCLRESLKGCWIQNLIQFKDWTLHAKETSNCRLRAQWLFRPWFHKIHNEVTQSFSSISLAVLGLTPATTTHHTLARAPD